MSDKHSEKLKLYASISNSKYLSKELASALGIPKEEDRQPDLQYLTAVFVSSGFNLNSAYFLPSELVKAKNSVVSKQLDIEHEQKKIVGHLYKSVFAKKDGTVFDPDTFMEQAGLDVESAPIDIVVGAVLYSSIFPEEAEKVESGEYCVSMECFYKDFDVIVDDIIIGKEEAKSLGLIDNIGKVIKVLDGETELGNKRVGRVLRDMIFSGCGLVKEPANPASVILETANVNSDYILDLTKVDSYMSAKKNDEQIVVNALKGCDKDSAFLVSVRGGIHTHEVNVKDDTTFMDGKHYHLVLPENVPSKYDRVYFSHDGDHKHKFESKTGKIVPEMDHVHKFYVEYYDEGTDAFKVKSFETGPSKVKHTHEINVVDVDVTEDEENKLKVKYSPGNYVNASGGEHYHELELEDGTKLKTVVPKDFLKKEAAASDYIGDSTGIEQVPEVQHCVSFKRYVYDRGPDNPGEPANVASTPGLVEQVPSNPIVPTPGGGAEPNQNDKVIHENWCALFETSCTTPGGQATHPDCLRLVLNRTTKEVVSSYIDRVLENRTDKDIKMSLASLKSLIEEAKKL